MSGRIAILAAVSAGLATCAPQFPEVRESPPAIPVETLWTLKLDASWPTDLLPLEGGGLMVLDGYHGRALIFDEERKPVGAIGDEPAWGRPVRMTPARAGGTWLVSPELGLLRVDDVGGLLQALPIQWPVAALDQGEALVVADRMGELLWLDAATGREIRRLTTDVDEIPLGILTDLAPTPGGGILAVDALKARVHRLGPQDAPRFTFGNYGLWVGSLAQPKAVAPVGEGGILVLDSLLGVGQLFNDKGEAVGILSSGDQTLRFEHPVAIEPLGEDGRSFLVLDAQTSTVHALRLEETALTDALGTPPQRWLRHPLVESIADPSGESGSTCQQCHDGFVMDGREVWDTARYHHPVGQPLERQLPDTLPLDEKGQMACTTCHSPHGEDHGQPFLRMSAQDASLCLTCHEDAAHDEALARLGLNGRGHPVGSALDEALAARGEAAASCMSCHAVHGAETASLTHGVNDGRICLACHEEQAEADLNHPMGLSATAATPRDSAHLPLDNAGRTTCQSCHDLLGGSGEALLRRPEDGGSLCGGCHTTEAREIHSKHGIHSGPQGLACLSCHDTHGRPLAADLLKLTRTASDPGGCTSCHDDVGHAGHPVEGPVPDEADPLSCESCHGDAHAPQPRGEPGCMDCHEEQAEAKHRGGHGGLSCLECHPPHEDPPLVRITIGTELPNPSAFRCLACHGEGTRAEAPKIPAYEHPDPVFTPGGARWQPLAGLPLFDARGNALPEGQHGDLTCASCHLTHGPPEGPQSTDHLRRPGWQTACASCHGTNALPLYRFFHQPARRAQLETTP